MTLSTPSDRALQARLSALSHEHQDSLRPFFHGLDAFVSKQALSRAAAAVVKGHLLLLAERGGSPSNTGNLEDLFVYTLADTQDPIRSFAQVLADSAKVVPMPEDSPLWPPLRGLTDQKRYTRISDLVDLSDGDRMLVCHTMVAYADPDYLAAAEAMVRTQAPELDPAGTAQAVAKMAVQSQHLPSSTFVMARASGLTHECAELYRQAGYSEAKAEAAQAFYDVCAAFEPPWADAFADGYIPTDPRWPTWRRAYLKLRQNLPEELIYQLASDTRTNFGPATLESGKWTEAVVAFGDVDTPEQVPSALARTVNQYLAEHVALHDQPRAPLIEAWTHCLAPWGIAFEDGRAFAHSDRPARFSRIQAQFESALHRKAKP